MDNTSRPVLSPNAPTPDPPTFTPSTWSQHGHTAAEEADFENHPDTALAIRRFVAEQVRPTLLSAALQATVEGAV